MLKFLSLSPKFTKERIMSLHGAIHYLASVCTFLVSSLCVFSQNDSIEFDKRNSRTAFGGVPICSYDADIGLRYGAVVNFFRYNDSVTETYSENVFLRIFNTTKKSFQIQSLYETDNLFKKSKTFIEATYINDKSYDFYGYNGNQSNYNPDFENPQHPSFLHENFYSIHRKFIRFRFDYQRYLTSPHLRLLLGAALNNTEIKRSEGDSSLSALYNQFEVIADEELKGGLVNYFTLGIVYEKRNNQNYCFDGKWFESFLILSPAVINAESFSKFITTFRSYDRILKSPFVLMTRASVQLRTSGYIPSYLKSTYFDTRLNQDGLGGAFNLRGFSRNRITSDGFGLLNLEVRRNVYQTKLKKTIVDCDLSLFSDNALILQEHPINKETISMHDQLKHFNLNYQKHYNSVGFGAYFILNKNNVISVNYGIPLKTNSKGALYIGSSFLF